MTWGRSRREEAMSERHNFLDTLQTFEPAPGRTGSLYSLPRLEAAGLGAVSRLPVCLRVVLESLLRNLDGQARRGGRRPPPGRPGEPRGRAHRRGAVHRGAHPAAGLHRRPAPGRPGRDALRRRPARPRPGRHRAARPDRPGHRPLGPGRLLADRRRARAQHGDRVRAQRRALPVPEVGDAARSDGFNVVPPGVGICHQVNLEHLAPGVVERDGVYFPTRWSAPTRTRR